MKCQKFSVFLVVSQLVQSVMTFKVAFVGDTGIETTGSFGFYAKATFEMLEVQGVDLIIQNGDLDYEHIPNLWDQFIQEYVYQKDMEILISSGNHEVESKHGSQWYGKNGYKDLMLGHLANSELLKDNCRGEYGELFVCEVHDILFIMIGWKQTESKSEIKKTKQFLKEILETTSQKIKFCTWHQPEGKLNPGDDELSNYETQELYEICRKSSAIITSGHSHIYARTKAISDFLPDGAKPEDNPSPEVSKKDEFNPKLKCGETFSIISGMGGYKFDGEGKYGDKDRFRTILTSEDSDDRAGALICEFNEKYEVNDEGIKFRCEFRLTTNVIIEEFEVQLSSETFGSQCSSETRYMTETKLKLVGLFVFGIGVLILALGISFLQRVGVKKKEVNESFVTMNNNKFKSRKQRVELFAANPMCTVYQR